MDEREGNARLILGDFNSTLENKRAAYNNISRLQRTIEVIDSSTSPQTITKSTDFTTKPDEILSEFQKQFQTIYKAQDSVSGNVEDIAEFFNSGND